MSDSTYYHRMLGRVFMHEKPNLCPMCKHRQEYGEWQGYCTVNEKILSSARGLRQKGRCKEFEKLESEIKMQGKRHDLEEDEYNLEIGEYGKSPDGKWFCHVPENGFQVGALGKHTVIEHSDKTISVYPSIVCEGENGKQWHGYLERGIWREV